MKLDRSDLPRLRGHLAAALLLTACGLACLFSAIRAFETARQELASRQAQRKEIGQQLDHLREEDKVFRERAALFERLRQQGLLGEARRLHWTSQLDALRERRKLPGLRYEVEPARPLDPAGGQGDTAVASTVRIELELLHEEDLTGFIEDLQKEASGLTCIRECRLFRRESGQTEHFATLRAHCRIEWITFRERTRQEGVK